MVYPGPMRLVEDERRIAHFFQRRDSSASASTSFVSILSSLPESPHVGSPSSNGFPASSQALATALSILALVILGMLQVASALCN